jgi:predicted DNA binding CopG/RHH family protein
MPKLPKFAHDQEESDFWDTHSTVDYLDETTPVDVTIIDARPRKTQISLRLDPPTITQLKRAARRRGIGYQTLIRMWGMERLSQEPGESAGG